MVEEACLNWLIGQIGEMFYISPFSQLVEGRTKNLLHFTGNE